MLSAAGSIAGKLTQSFQRINTLSRNMKETKRLFSSYGLDAMEGRHFLSIDELRLVNICFIFLHGLFFIQVEILIQVPTFYFILR